MKSIRTFLLGSVVLVSACSSETDEQKKIDYASFDDAAVAAFIDRGDFRQALEILKGQMDLGIADTTDYRQTIRIYLELQDGVAAEVAIERAVENGIEADELRLPRARALFLQNRSKEAEAVLAEGDGAESNSVGAKLLRGDIANKEGTVDKARYHYRDAISMAPDDFRGYLSLALLELAAGNLDEAKIQAEQAGLHTQGNSLVSYAQGMVDRYQGNLDSALKHLSRSVELTPSNLVAHLELASIHIDQGQPELARQKLDIVYGMVPEHGLAHYYTALLLAQDGEFQKAEALLLRTGDLTKGYPPAARTYGLITHQLGKYSTAEPYLSRYLDLAPTDRIVRLALAECLTNRGQAQMAQLTLEPLLGLDQQDHEAYLQAASAAASLGDVRTARKYFEMANDMLAQNGADDTGQARLLQTKIALARFLTGDEAEAKEQLRALYQGDPSDQENLILLANMQLSSGDLASAEETAKQLTDINPDNPVSYNLLGAIRYRQGLVDDALVLYSKALSVKADYESALKNRGLAYLSLRKFVPARDDLRALLKKVPNDMHGQAMLGRVYLELNDPKAALPYLKAAGEAIPASALIATDYAEALAGSGFTVSAIQQAQTALKLAEGKASLVEYLNDLLTVWNKAEADRKAAEQATREQARDELAKRKAEREKEAAERAKTEQERLEKERLEKEQAEKEKAEQDKPAPAAPDDPAAPPKDSGGDPAE